MTIRTAPLVLTILSLSYIPVFLFIAGWCKVWIAVPLCLLLIVILAKFGKGMITPPGRADYDSYDVRMRPTVFVFICLFIVSFGLFSGYGHWADAYTDWPKHYAILHDLTQNDWPVCYLWTDGTHRMLSYYTGVYLLPAAIGKVWGGNIVVAECVLGIYSSVLTLCFILLLINYLGCDSARKQLLCILSLLLFYGMSALCHKLNFWMGCRGGCHEVIADLPEIYYLTFRPLIKVFSTYIQGIAPLGLFLCLLMDKKPFGHIGIYLLPIFLFTPFILVGATLLYLLFFVFEKLHKRMIMMDLFTFENMAAILAGIFILLYYSGNLLLEKPENTGVHLITIKSVRNLMVFLSFCLFLYGIHLILLWQSFHWDSLFVALCCTICVIPLFTMGTLNDWCQNCSLPLSLLLFIYIWNFYKNPRQKLKKIILSCFLAMGTFVPLQEAYNIIRHGVSSQRWNYQTDGLMDHLNDEDPANRLSYRYNYVSGDINTDLFYQYFARKNDL